MTVVILHGRIRCTLHYNSVMQLKMQNYKKVTSPSTGVT